jgi:uncharacterized membrane protein
MKNCNLLKFSLISITDSMRKLFKLRKKSIIHYITCYTNHVLNKLKYQNFWNNNFFFINFLQLGRYWNKEERKKHVERSRERRKQHELMAREHDEAKQARTKSFQSSSSSSRRRELRDHHQHQQQQQPPPPRICPPTAVLSSRGGKMAAGILSVTTV